MKLPRKVLWGMGVALTFLVVTPVSAGWNIYDIGKHPGTPPASEGIEVPEESSEVYPEEEWNDPIPDDIGADTSESVVDELLGLDNNPPSELPVNDGGPTGEFQVTQVPEPGSLALLAMGLGALGFGRRRKLTK